MNDFLISEMFRLELRWERVSYNREGTCEFTGAYFTGPAVQLAQKLNDKDHMFIDFYSQYISLVQGTFVGKFSWSGATYSEDGKKIFLDKSFLTHERELNNVPKLNDTDYFAIDTSDHIAEKHSYNLVYKTYLISADAVLYRFEK